MRKFVVFVFLAATVFLTQSSGSEKVDHPQTCPAGSLFCQQNISTSSTSSPTPNTRFLLVWKNSLSAVLAELPSIILSYPFSRMSTLNQLERDPQRRISWIASLDRKSYRSHLNYNGLLMMIIVTQISKMLYWGVYYFLFYYVFTGSTPKSNILTSTSSSTSYFFLYKLLSALQASTIAGIISVVITNPLWVVCTNLQVDTQGLGLQGLGLTTRHLFRGLAFNLLLVSYPTITQVSFVFLVDTYRGIFGTPPNASLHGCIGAVATIFATVITYPLQTLRTRQQAVDVTTTVESSLQNNRSSPCPRADETSPCRPCKGEQEGAQMHTVGYEESVIGKKDSSQLVSTDGSSSNSSSSNCSSNDSSKTAGSISKIGIGLGSELSQFFIKSYSGVGLKILSCAVHGFTFYLVKNLISRYYSYIPSRS